MSALGRVVPDFRERCLELALQRLSPLFAELTGVTGRGLRFDVLEFEKVRKELAVRLAVFLKYAEVEPVPEDLRVGRPGLPERRLAFERERERLQEAGLRFSTEE